MRRAVCVYTSPQMRTATCFRSVFCRRRSWRLTFIACLLGALPLRPAAARAQAKPADHLLIYAIDVEGGQSTLLVETGTGASLLVDTGWPTPDGRDATRIQAAMADAGITRIDHVLITHFHTRPRGRRARAGQARPQVGEFLDHGPNREDSDITRTRLRRLPQSH
jgi:beta-lactamase superfamily II metal-dependent hydrolase